MERNFDNLFKLTSTALKINQLHPNLKRGKLWFMMTSSMCSLVVSGFCLISHNLINHDLKIENNFSETCKNGTILIVYVMIGVQFIVLIISKEPLKKLIKDMNNDFELSKKMTSEEQMIMQSYIDQGTYVCKQWLLTTLSSLVAFLGKNFVLHFYFYWIDEYRLVHFYDLVYPDFIEKRKDNIIPYLTLYIYLLSYTLYSVAMYTSYVPLGPIMMLHACGQLEIVRRRIENLFVELDDKVIQEKMKMIIIRLQYIYNFVERITNIFKIAYELTLKGTTIILPVTFYQVIETSKRGELSIEFTTFIIGGVLISATPCYYSNLLKDKGEEVRMSLYTCGWERYYTRRARTSLSILLLYALRPVAIKTVFRTLCLDALTDLFQQAYAIFNLINSVY